jgi:hypothetical protein
MINELSGSFAACVWAFLPRFLSYCLIMQHRDFPLLSASRSGTQSRSFASASRNIRTTCLRASHAPVAAPPGYTAVCQRLEAKLRRQPSPTCFSKPCEPAVAAARTIRRVGQTCVLRCAEANICVLLGMFHVSILPVASIGSILPGHAKYGSPDRLRLTSQHTLAVTSLARR